MINVHSHTHAMHCSIHLGRIRRLNIPERERARARARARLSRFRQARRLVTLGIHPADARAMGNKAVASQRAAQGGKRRAGGSFGSF